MPWFNLLLKLPQRVYPQIASRFKIYNNSFRRSSSYFLSLSWQFSSSEWYPLFQPGVSSFGPFLGGGTQRQLPSLARLCYCTGARKDLVSLHLVVAISCCDHHPSPFLTWLTYTHCFFLNSSLFKDCLSSMY